MPAPHHDDIRSPRAHRRLPAKPLLFVAGAFALGLLLFLLLWWRDRGNDFYRPDVTAPAAADQQFEALPAPLPANEAGDTASGMEAPTERPGQPPPHIIPAPPQPPAAPIPAAAPPVELAAGTAPQPIQMPAPQYPPEAFRNGESGTVLLRVHVGPDGVPYAVDLVQSSRSRALDRAANEAVRRWRFRPAIRDGQPVAGEVQVPISFNAER
ncbi:MAG: energy transducer TonB [Luteimonas sp.]